MMDELLTQFLVEAPELVQQGNDALLALERRPDDRAATDEAFRAFHTLKGSVGLFDLPAMGLALHAGEDVLSAIRSGGRVADSEAVDGLLAVLSQSERWLSAIEAEGGLPNGAGEVARRLVDQLKVGAAGSVGIEQIETPGWAEALRATTPAQGALTAVRYAPTQGAYFAGDDPVALMAGLPGLVRFDLALEPDGGETDYDPFTCRLILLALTTATVAEARAVLRFVPDQVEVIPLTPHDSPDHTPSGATDRAGLRTLRVEAERIERLAALTDELVVARTALAALSTAAKTDDIRGLIQALATQSKRLDRLTGQIHHQVTALRMTPVAPLLRRFPRVARDLARSLGKEVDVLVEDNGVEADKTIFDGLLEPLTHLIRNAVDHGVETPADRQKVGKPRKGAIHLATSAVSGRFELILGDDGAGLDPAEIRSAVVRKGLMSAEAVQALADNDIIDLIFLPGFSTASALTDVSGRGVGMDAVRTAVQRLGGRIAIDSTTGQGTTVRISLPLNLALTKIIVVTAGADLYGVPIDCVLEIVRVSGGAVSPIRAGRAFAWRRRTVPLLSLATLVGGDASLTAGDDTVLIIQAGQDLVGLTVDAIDHRADVVVRPLDGLLADMPGVDGTTLLGDGRVLMVLDPEVLVG